MGKQTIPETVYDEADTGIVDRFKKELQKKLMTDGYKPVWYSQDLPQAVGYTKDPKNCIRRSEPVLIDEGGEIGVLKIAIRDVSNNPHLDTMVRTMLAEIGIENPQPGSSKPCAEGTKVYAVRRV